MVLISLLRRWYTPARENYLRLWKCSLCISSVIRPQAVAVSRHLHLLITSCICCVSVIDQYLSIWQVAGGSQSAYSENLLHGYPRPLVKSFVWVSWWWASWLKCTATFHFCPRHCRSQDAPDAGHGHNLPMVSSLRPCPCPRGRYKGSGLRGLRSPPWFQVTFDRFLLETLTCVILMYLTRDLRKSVELASSMNGVNTTLFSC